MVKFCIHKANACMGFFKCHISEDAKEKLRRRNTFAADTMGGASMEPSDERSHNQVVRCLRHYSR